MLPTNRMRDVQLRRLNVYAGAQHPHEAQKPRRSRRYRRSRFGTKRSTSFNPPGAAKRAVATRQAHRSVRASSRSTASQSTNTSRARSCMQIVRQPLEATQSGSRVRRAGQGRRRRRDRPSRRGSPRHRARAAGDRRIAQGDAAQERLPHARPARKRIEEVRSQARPQALPVQQTLRTSLKIRRDRAGRDRVCSRAAARRRGSSARTPTAPIRSGSTPHSRSRIAAAVVARRHRGARRRRSHRLADRRLFAAAHERVGRPNRSLLLDCAAIVGLYAFWFELSWGWNYARAPIESARALRPIARDAGRAPPRCVARAMAADERAGGAGARARRSVPLDFDALRAAWLPAVQRAGDDWTPRVGTPKPTIADPVHAWRPARAVSSIR